jgi:DNA-binding LytR/AlgR family response regulator
VKKIVLPSSDGLLLIPEQEISYIKSENIYSYVHNGTEKYFTTCSLKEIEALLDRFYFFRCHRSYIVNLDKIVKITKSQNCHIHLVNGEDIPVSRNKKKAILEILLKRAHINH